MTTMLHSAQNKTHTSKGVNQERRCFGIMNQIRRAHFAVADELADWLFDNDINTLEKMLISFRIAMAFGLLILAARIIAIPPPYLQSYFLTLPTWTWALLLAIGVIWQLNGRKKDSYIIRRNASMFSSLVLIMLLGPLFLRAPGMGALTMVDAIFELTVFVRLWKLCHE